MGEGGHTSPPHLDSNIIGIILYTLTSSFKIAGSFPAFDYKASSLIVFDNEGKPAPFHCLHDTNRHAKCLGFLLESSVGIDPNILDQHGTPILCAVSEGGYDKQLEKLLDNGADPNARDFAKDGKPAVVLAAERGHHECVKLLMVGGADGNATYGEKGMCALHR